MVAAINRYWKRRISQHIGILLATTAGTAIFWALFSDRRDLISHLSIATAYPTLFLTAAALFVGPWNVLRRPGSTGTNARGYLERVDLIVDLIEETETAAVTPGHCRQ